MKITRRCMLTGQENTREINCTQEQLDRWERGELIQYAMPHLSPGDREFLMTGITPEVWNDTFKKA